MKLFYVETPEGDEDIYFALSMDDVYGFIADLDPDYIDYQVEAYRWNQKVAIARDGEVREQYARQWIQELSAEYPGQNCVWIAGTPR